MAPMVTATVFLVFCFGQAALALLKDSIYGLALIYVVRDLPGIEQFKIVQESTERTRVLVVPGEGYVASLADRIRVGLRQRLGAGVDVEIETVAEIPAERSGKFRYVVSRVAPSL